MNYVIHFRIFVDMRQEALLTENRIKTTILVVVVPCILAIAVCRQFQNNKYETC